MKQFFDSTIRKTTLYYTLIISMFCIIMLISHSSEETLALDPTRMLLFLPFSLVFAIANTTLKYKNIEAVTRWLFHFVLTVLGAFLFIILPADLQTSSGNFIGFIMIIVVYMLGVLLYAFFCRRVRNTLKEDKQLKENSKKRMHS